MQAASMTARKAVAFGSRLNKRQLSMKRPVVIATALALVIAGVVAAVAGCVPFERMQAVGALVRRASDFTPERFARFRHVCWFFALALPALAAWLWRLRSRPDESHPTSLAVSRTSVTPETRVGWLLWLIIAVGFALRFQRLFDPVAYDEAYTYLNFGSRPWYEAIGDYNSTNNHLLNTLLMHVSTRVFGPQEWAMRWHVLFAGTVLPWAVFVWGREWLGRAAGLIAAAAVAVSPMLITYSTDARGYMLVTLAAIVFDASLARLSQTNRRAWWTAWGALVFGLCSMPLMVYAAVGSAAWFAATPCIERRGNSVVKERIRSLGALGLLAVPAVAAFYTPAYILRGMMFLSDPIVQADSADGFAAALATAWKHAFEWWTDGIVPGWLWGILALIGFALMPRGAARWRWILPFAVVLVLNIVQHVAPPPRIYMHLAPWLFLAAAFGVESLVLRFEWSSLRAATIVAACVLAAGGLYARNQLVLFNFSERKDYGSVPEVIHDLERNLKLHPDERCVLLAPLPCDLPSIFYLRRAGIELPVNVRPQSMDRVFLIVPSGETPDGVLATPLLNMADVPFLEDWLSVGPSRSRAHGRTPLALYMGICARTTERQ